MTDDDALVERVAQAIRNAVCNRERLNTPASARLRMGAGRPWERLPDQLQDDYRHEARAAIAAMRAADNRVTMQY